jgi:hypothetical protein
MPMKKLRHAHGSSLRNFVFLMLPLVVGLSGCRQKVVYQPPKTYPVSGKVIVSPRKAPAGSLITFAPKDTSLTAQGRIEQDGSFTLQTLFHKQMLPGAVEGPHRVIVLPLINNGPGPAINAKKTYTVEPKENQFTIQLD